MTSDLAKLETELTAALNRDVVVGVDRALGDRCSAHDLHSVQLARLTQITQILRTDVRAFVRHADPAESRLSPGVATVLLAVEMARERGIPHVYLGFRVMGCASMRYKAGYRPHELLQGLPGPDEEPRWVPAE